MVLDPTPADRSRPFRLFPVKGVGPDSLEMATYVASAAKSLLHGNGGGIFIQDSSSPAYTVTDNMHPSGISQQL